MLKPTNKLIRAMERENQPRVQHFKDALLRELRIDIDSKATRRMPTH